MISTVMYFIDGYCDNEFRVYSAKLYPGEISRQEAF